VIKVIDHRLDYPLRLHGCTEIEAVKPSTQFVYRFTRRASSIMPPMGAYSEPKYNGQAYTCPHCGVYAHMVWADLGSTFKLRGWKLLGRSAQCQHCLEIQLWHDERMIEPLYQAGPQPDESMPPEVKEDYLEARRIAPSSPRGAAALLRLALQKLCKSLGGDGKNLNQDIAVMMKKGMDPQIQKALDIVRVIGNHAVHPGQIDLKDDPVTVASLFGLINFIVETMIRRPEEVQALYAGLPQSQLDAIAVRDNTP
jgi:hypothetical protein